MGRKAQTIEGESNNEEGKCVRACLLFLKSGKQADGQTSEEQTDHHHWDGGGAGLIWHHDWDVAGLHGQWWVTYIALCVQ